MATNLTPRQKEVQKLLDKGKKPSEIAKQLGISQNAVYQQRRRIKQLSDNGASAAPANKPVRQGRRPRRTTTTERPRRSNRETVVTPKVEIAPISPLEAIHARRAEIEDQLNRSEVRLSDVRVMYEETVAEHDTLVANNQTELDRLTWAEKALTGELKQKAAGRRGKIDAAEKEAPAEAPAPAPEPTPEPEPVAVAQDPGLIGEGPVPEFQQTADAF